MDIHRYLNRFRAAHNEPSLANLTNLQQLHLLNIPFENLDVIRKEPIYLNLNTIYQKIVDNHRGGYCYELNGLFQFLLKKLDYDTHLVSATVLRPNNKWAKADTHTAILVYLDQPYLVDVGFGGATPRIPIPLNGSAETVIHEDYRTEQQSDDTFHLIRTAGGETRTLYRFNTYKKTLIDFHEGCVFNQVSKDSTFTHTDIIAMATETGRITLRDHTLTRVENSQTTKSILSANEKEEIIKDIFSLSLK